MQVNISTGTARQLRLYEVCREFMTEIIPTENERFTVDDNAPTTILLDPNGGDKDVIMPSAKTKRGCDYYIINTSDATGDVEENLFVKNDRDDEDTDAIAKIPKNRSANLFSDGTKYYAFVGREPT